MAYWYTEQELNHMRKIVEERNGGRREQKYKRRDVNRAKQCRRKKMRRDVKRAEENRRSDNCFIMIISKIALSFLFLLVTNL